MLYGVCGSPPPLSRGVLWTRMFSLAGFHAVVGVKGGALTAVRPPNLAAAEFISLYTSTRGIQPVA